MASEEQKRLASLIKNVHQELRVESRKMGARQAWEKHLQQGDILKNYSQAMQQLATEYWDRNADDETNQKAKSRVQWVIEQCETYFYQQGKIVSYLKEIDQCKKYDCYLDIYYKDLKDNNLENSPVKLMVLDVGSCYNPFKSCEQFDVIPIDIAPATSEVYQCDFLNVEVTDCQRIDQIGRSIKKLPSTTFSVVIFSLLLEYLPSAEQRYICCKKAGDLLMSEGILCIVTPDSKHATANAPIMKGWRYALASLGLLRIKYEKLPHMHCMVYRKCINPDLPNRWLVSCMEQNLRKGCPPISPPEKLMIIPQDFHFYEEKEENTSLEKLRDSDDNVALMFEDLPQV